MAFITDSSQNGPNGIIVVDLASGKSWRRLHDHPSTKAEQLQTFLPIVEGRPFLEHQPDGSVKQGAGMGSDGIAISSDGTRLYYCPLGSRKLYSVDTDAQMDLNLMRQGISTQLTTSTTLYCDDALAASGRRWHMTRASYGLIPSRLLLTGIFTSQPTSCTARGASIKDVTYAANPMPYSASASMPSLFC
jgi:hypothetical protein